MVDMVTIAGTGIGAIGVAIGTYSLYKQRNTQEQMDRLEDQMDRKEELRNLSGKLGDLKQPLERMHRGLAKDVKEGDPWILFQDLSKNILAYEHYSGEIPRIKVDFIGFRTNSEELPYKNVSDTKVKIKDRYRPSIRLEPEIQDDAESFVWGLYVSDPFLSLYRLFEIKEEIEEHQEIISQFDETLLREIEVIVVNIVENIFEHADHRSSGKIFDPTEFKNVDTLALEVYEYFIEYDGFEDDLEELSNILKRTEEVRKTVLEASYS